MVHSTCMSGYKLFGLWDVTNGMKPTFIDMVMCGVRGTVCLAAHAKMESSWSCLLSYGCVGLMRMSEYLGQEGVCDI